MLFLKQPSSIQSITNTSQITVMPKNILYLRATEYVLKPKEKAPMFTLTVDFLPRPSTIDLQRERELLWLA